MNFVSEYYDFKQMWHLKIGNLLSDCYISKEYNTSVEKIKYLYFEEVIKSYINHEEIDEKLVEEKLKIIDYKALNNLECELLKYVIQTSDNFKYTEFNQTDYIYYTVLLELTISMYNVSFMEINKNIIMNILKENLFRFPFIDFKMKQSKINLLVKYIKYIKKYISYYFSNLNNKNIEINVTSLTNHKKYYVVEIKNKLDELLKFEEELIESVDKNKKYSNKLFMLNFDLLIQEVTYLLEKNRFSIDKVIFNLDNYNFTRSSINYINYSDCLISKYIMFSSKNKKLLDIINNKFNKAVYLEGDLKTDDYKDMNIIVKKSFWNNHKRNSKKLSDLNFITINDNISYKFNKEEY